MTRYLCISVTFLDPLYHGRTDGDRRGEWPPSPLRLFQALLAGARAGSRNRDWSDAKAAAFRWLERRDPPEILAPNAQPAPSYTLFVPNNDADAPNKFDRQERLTSKVARPHRLVDGQTLHYLWEVADSEWSEPDTQTAVDLLCQESRQLLAFGWGIDQVVGFGRLVTNSDAETLRFSASERWHPHPGTETRVPAEGTLRDLERAYQEFVDTVQPDGSVRVPTRVRRFRTVAYRRLGALPDRPYAAFELRRLDDPERWRPFRQEEANAVAAMLRSLTCAQKADFSQTFPKDDSSVYLAGHVNGNADSPPRFSYLPLPTVGHPHADGMIRRVLIAEPIGGDRRHAQWAASRLCGRELIDHNNKPVALLLAAPNHDPMIERYTAAGKIWSSVTPVILPGYDNFKAIRNPQQNRPTKAERLLLKCLQQAGIPPESVAHVTMRKAPFWPGSLHPRQYRRPKYLEDQCANPGWHVHLVFRERIAGPLAVGAGRHCGLGLFAPC